MLSMTATASTAIPSIAPYRVPVAGELPANRVPWLPDPRRAVLLVHDMQNYFVGRFTSASPPLAPAVGNIGRLRRHAAALGVPVVYSAQPPAQRPEQRGLQADFWGSGMGADGREAAIVDELAPGPEESVMTKWRYSAFVHTDLAERLGDRDQLVLTGVYAHIGVLATACDAFMRDIQPFVVADAVADFSARHHHQALSYAVRRLGVVMTCEHLCDEMERAAEAGPPAREGRP